MPPRSCKVTVKDTEGISHTVEVTASTLYEAVALGVAAIRDDDWVEAAPTGFNSVKVQVTTIPVEHKVQIKDLLNWLGRTNVAPRDIIQRKRIREVFGDARAAKVSSKHSPAM